MSESHASANASSEHGGTMKWYMTVWIVLLSLTGVEVFLAYIHLPVGLMLSILMGLSIIKAAMIIGYFMHLRYERVSLKLVLLPMWIMCTLLLFVVFPDSFRIQEWHWPR